MKWFSRYPGESYPGDIPALHPSDPARHFGVPNIHDSEKGDHIEDGNLPRRKRQKTSEAEPAYRSPSPIPRQLPVQLARNTTERSWRATRRRATEAPGAPVISTGWGSAEVGRTAPRYRHLPQGRTDRAM